ncbi:MAG: ABC transporter permease [Verrucomicrobiota bacterium]|jgi:phospholipid/cholesterol/gamma-HCH transport system permease protein
MENSAATIRLNDEVSDTLRLIIEGELRTESIASTWGQARQQLLRAKNSQVVIDAKGVNYCDGTGIAMLADLLLESHRSPALKITLEGLRPPFQLLLDQFDLEHFKPSPDPKPECLPIAEEVGKTTFGILKDLKWVIQFVGESTHGLALAMRHPSSVRWKDAIWTMETAGVNALPIVCLICFLIGLIMAFQSAIPLKQFAAELFIANLVSVAMLRELGPLMTAILLAGRSGSAFAAEIGTMKVNEEINALQTMGLNPVRFLAIPRILGAVAVTPLLTLFANFMGLVGGWVVYLSLGFPTIVYVNQIRTAVTLTDLWGGLFKAAVFGLLVAGIGCLRGLQTRIGASAVGLSTTRAVVSGIVLIVIADGVFSVLYYLLGI